MSRAAQRREAPRVSARAATQVARTPALKASGTLLHEMRRPAGHAVRLVRTSRSTACAPPGFGDDPDSSSP
jgi:hypothetical protein